jgi:hypothetical protein
MPAMQQTRTRRGSKESQAVTSVLHALLRAQQTMCAVLIEAETRHVRQHALKSHENHGQKLLRALCVEDSLCLLKAYEKRKKWRIASSRYCNSACGD